MHKVQFLHVSCFITGLEDAIVIYGVLRQRVEFGLNISKRSWDNAAS